MTYAPTLTARDRRFKFEIAPGKHIFIPRGVPAGRWFRAKCGKGFHEPVMSRLVLSFMERHPETVFVDGGALFGYFGLLAHLASNGRCTSIFFEMNPESYAQLREIIALNPHLDTPKLRAVHSALSDEPETARITSYDGFRFTEEGVGQSAKIDFRRMDEALIELGVENDAPKLIKLDVEGFEGRVLKGMTGLSADTVLLELHNDVLLTKWGSSRVQVIDQAFANGYRVFALGRHREALGDVAAFEILMDDLEELKPRLTGRGDDLFVLTRGDIREVWPEVESADELPTPHLPGADGGSRTRTPRGAGT